MPNNEKQPCKFDDDLVSVQLDSIGVLPIFNLMHHGYGAKVSYEEIAMKMSPHIANIAKLDAKAVCRDIFTSMHCSSNSFKLGKTHIFFRHKYEHFVDKFNALNSNEMRQVAEDIAKCKSRQRYALWIALRFAGRGKVFELSRFF